MLPANPYWENPRIELAKGFVTFWDRRCEYFSYILELVSRYSIPHLHAKFQVCKSYQFLNQFRTNKQTNKQTNHCDLIYKIRYYFRFSLFQKLKSSPMIK